jgi:hypothetical protein
MFASKYTLKYICGAILLVFTVTYFIIANNISYAFTFDENQVKYENKINTIKVLSQLYGNDHVELFDEKQVIYITVQDLVDQNYLTPDENGKVNDPTSEVKTLNETKIRLANKNGQIVAKVLIDDK